MSAGRQISRPQSVRLLADLLGDAEREVEKLRTLLVKHLCDCIEPAADPLNAHNHAGDCAYRNAMES